MKSPTSKQRFAEAQKLLDYGFNNYMYKEFANAGDVVKTINVEKGVKSTANVICEETSGVLIEKGQENGIVQKIELDDSIEAPIKNNDKVGEIQYYINDEIIATTNLIIEENIDKINVFNMSAMVLENWVKLLR